MSKVRERAGRITVATCQFDVSAGITQNFEQMKRQTLEAAGRGADVVHFSECSLSGYAGVDYDSWLGFDWPKLEEATLQMQGLAKENGLRLIFGRPRQIETDSRPHNSLYVINPAGEIECCYDKRFCTPADLAFYKPGNRFVTFVVNHVVCSVLICYDVRFPELYRELKKLGVECLFQSFYNAKQAQMSVHRDIMRQSMQCRAATNYFWASMTNSSAPISPYPSCFIRPDGVIVAQCEENRPDMIINTIDTSVSYYDASAPFRDAAMNGKLNNAIEQA